MNPLISLLRWSIQGMRKEHTRVPLVGLGSQFYPIFRFFPWKVGHTQSCGQLCALVVMRQSSSLCILQCNIYIYILHCSQQCMPNTLLAVCQIQQCMPNTLAVPLKLWLPMIPYVHLQHAPCTRCTMHVPTYIHHVQHAYSFCFSSHLHPTLPLLSLTSCVHHVPTTCTLGKTADRWGHADT